MSLRRNAYFLICWVLLFASIRAFALNTNEFVFKHFDYENGLISNWANAIVQDSDGFMWFGTSDGLSRFDGYGYKNFVNNPGDSHSLNNNFISDITEDVKRNCMWVVTPLGVSKLDKTTYHFKNYAISDSKKGVFSPFSRGSVCVDKDGTVWVEGFSEVYAEGLFKYDDETDDFINISKIRDDVPSNLSIIYKDKSDKLWFGTTHGLYAYIPETDQYKQIPLGISGKDSLYITSLCSDADGRLWIGTHQDHSIYVLEKDTIKLFYTSHYSHDDFNWISGLAMYNNTILMVSVKDLGVIAIDTQNGESELLQPDLYNPRGLNSKNPFAIYADKAGNIWIGTYNHGVNFLDIHRKKFNLYQFNFTKNGLPSNNVRAFFEDSEGELWVGTKQGGGLSKFDPSTGTFENYMADLNNPNWLDNDIVICINELDKDKLLVGTYGKGIYQFDKRKKSFRKFAMPNGNANSISDKYVYAIYKDRDDRIWIGSNSSVDIYHTVTGTFSHPKGVNYARCFLDDGKSILIGTWTKGLYVYDKKEKLIHNYVFKHPDLHKKNGIRINGMAQDGKGYVWLATNLGLVRYAQGEEKELWLTKKDGLPVDYYCAVLVDDKNIIWASTKEGIVKYNPEKNKSQLYNKFDGLQSNVFEHFVSLKTRNGEMLFSGTNGFNMFHPDSIIDNPNVPKVHLSEMRILNEVVNIGSEGSPLTKDISLTKELKLKHTQSSFSFGFVAVNYTSPEKSKYQYMLEGYDEEWNEADERRVATYTRVPSGKYTFKVKASNNDGLWSTEMAEVKIRVKPPFSRSYVAFTLYLLLLIAFLLGFQMIVRHNAIQKGLLEEEIRENKRLEELSRKRIRFFTNISHELRTPLTLIAAPLDRLSNYNTNDKQLISLFKIMNRNAQRLLRIVNQLMDFRRIEENRIQLRVAKDNIVVHVDEILASFNDIVNNRGIKLDFYTNVPNGYNAWFDVSILDKILFNLLSNAVKFSAVNGEIKVEVLIENNKATLNVIDQGIGIEKENIDKIFERFYTTDQAEHNVSGAGVGLSFTKSLVELHKGEIKVSSEFGKGSCFTVILPVAEEAYNVSERQEEKAEEVEVVAENISEFVPDDRAAIEEDVVKEKELILIVEDYEDLREYLIHNLNNYNVISCANGKEALKLAHDKMPDLILSDIMMPEMDGLEMCKQIKTSIITSHIPVILLTSRISAEQKLEGFIHYADAYVEKPFSIDLLAMQIANMIQLRKNISAKYNTEIIENSTEDGMMPLDKTFLDSATKIIEENLSDPELSVESLSAELGMSRSQLFRKFKALTNTTPSQFLKVARLKKAAELLSAHEHNVNEVAFMVGFADASHFIASFKKYYSQTPKQFTEKNKRS